MAIMSLREGRETVAFRGKLCYNGQTEKIVAKEKAWKGIHY